MLTERQDLRIEVRIEPVGLGDRGLQVVDHERLRRAPEVLEGVLQAAEKIVRSLSVDGLAVRLPRVAEHDPEQVRSAPLALWRDHWRVPFEIHLGFGARLTLQPPKRKGRRASQLADESTDRVITQRGAMLSRQILVNPNLSKRRMSEMGDYSTDVISQIDREFIAELLRKGERFDGRAFDEYRPIEIELDPVAAKADGSAIVRLGGTTVIAGVSVLLGEPYPDSPAQPRALCPK